MSQKDKEGRRIRDSKVGSTQNRHKGCGHLWRMALSGIYGFKQPGWHLFKNAMSLFILRTKYLPGSGWVVILFVGSLQRGTWQHKSELSREVAEVVSS